MMSGRPKQPKYARNKNILVIGGSGSGKTRFFVKPNLMQMHSSYVVTDPKETVLEEVGTMLARGAWELDDKGNKVPKVGKNGQVLKTKSGKVIYKRTPYKIKVFNTINFAKSMHYNPFAYIHTEQDVLKFVNTLIANTKGEGAQSGEDFWVKAERLLFTAYVAYIVKYCKNVHFKKPFAPTYMEQLKQMEADGMVSLRGLRKDATLFNEIVIDVNTMYFERNGGYEYAKQFYEETYHFIEEKFGADNIISAVMHADEINVAATEELGKEVYHYHLHAMVLPVVEKEILWSKRCKDEKLRGTVKEVVNQISHSKKWKSDIPLTDEKGNPLLRKNGKPMFRASYSILQDELFNHMTEQGFKGFQRGEYGSTAEHLTSLQYQIKQDKERLEKLQKRIQREQIKYEPARNVSKTYNEIDRMGQKTITGKMAISKEDYSQLTALAKEGITSRAEISELEQSANYYRQKYFDCANALERMKTKYNELKEKCRPFLQALEHFPEVSKLFTEKVKQLFSFKEAQERAEKEAREKERQERIKARRNKRDMER